MSYRQLETQADSPERVQPEPEKYAGVNLPYRGTEYHGIDPDPNVNYDTDQMSWPKEDEPEYLPDDDVKEPIAVRIVDRSALERRCFRVWRHACQGIPQRVLGRNDRRVAVRIRNISSYNGGVAGVAWIGSDNQVSTLTGFPIDSDFETEDFVTTEEIWAMTDSPSIVELVVIETYTKEV